MLDGDQDPKTGFSADLRPLHRKSSNDKRSYLKHDLKVRLCSGKISLYDLKEWFIYPMYHYGN